VEKLMWQFSCAVGYLGLPLVMGHSDDDRQIDDMMILELQKAFADKDPTGRRLQSGQNEINSISKK
jgi:hypothetical protein